MEKIFQKKPRLIVIGDIMLDHLINIQIEKIANEAPIPVYNFLNENYNLGGAGNVLKNLHSLGCEHLHVFGAVGNDSYGDKIYNLLSELHVINHVSKLDNYNTTVKL